MSAMHWEARRRQNVLDRRISTKTKQCLTVSICSGLEGDSQKQNTVEEGLNEVLETSSELSEPLVIDKRIICRSQAEKKEQYSAKIENRYTSTQYFQQW